MMLHTDNSMIRSYEFDGSNGLDSPIVESEAPVMKQIIIINSPSITVVDRAVSTNSVTIAKVAAATDGWMVIHDDDRTGKPVIPAIIGKTYVQVGVNENGVINLDTNRRIFKVRKCSNVTCR